MTVVESSEVGLEILHAGVEGRWEEIISGLLILTILMCPFGAYHAVPPRQP